VDEDETPAPMAKLVAKRIEAPRWRPTQHEGRPIQQLSPPAWEKMGAGGCKPGLEATKAGARSGRSAGFEPAHRSGGNHERRRRDRRRPNPCEERASSAGGEGPQPKPRWPRPASSPRPKGEILKERVRVRLWKAKLGEHMDWTLVTILIAAVICHLIVAGLGG